MLVLSLKILIPFLIIFNIIPFLIWLERKGCAFIQDRHGPNRASVMGLRVGGLLHSIADVLKLLTKEDIIPTHANKIFYVMAPFMTLLIACVTYAVIPFAQPIQVGGEIFTFQAANLNVGILYILAISSLGVYGVMLAGWSSNNKYSLLGGLRASAQMFSYELSMGLAILSIVLMSGTLELGGIITDQTATPWHWNFVRQPLACLLFITAPKPTGRPLILPRESQSL